MIQNRWVIERINEGTHKTGWCEDEWGDEQITKIITKIKKDNKQTASQPSSLNNRKKKQ